MNGRVLLHVCCGPCAVATVEMLRDEGFEVTGLFLNPNIHPLQEYLRRRDAALETAERMGFKLIVRDAEYDPAAYMRAVAFREANRCFHCYEMRLSRAVQIAKRGNFDAFTSTLLYSKHQKHEVIKGLCADLATGSVPFLYRDFRAGWQRGIEESKRMGIYRQQYCGCLYSEVERYQKELRRDRESSS
jgi:predicted adenine nucleotide alpha hydrolase (AANH) superfamily ATPase